MLVPGRVWDDRQRREREVTVHRHPYSIQGVKLKGRLGYGSSDCLYDQSVLIVKDFRRSSLIGCHTGTVERKKSGGHWWPRLGVRPYINVS